MSTSTIPNERSPKASRRRVDGDAEAERMLPELAFAPPFRELSQEEAIARILAHLREHGQTDSFELALALDLDPEEVESLCADLARHRQIAAA
jgi:hypothetical protein